MPLSSDPLILYHRHTLQMFLVSLLLLVRSPSVAPFILKSGIRHSIQYGISAKSLHALSPTITPEDLASTPCVLKVVGVGGGGGNAVRRMVQTGVTGPEFWALNTDMQALGAFRGTTVNTLNIGQDVTRGLGAGSDPANGRLAAESSRADISKVVENTDLLFITAGMGGGTGSGAAPIVAEIARNAGALTVGIVTKPFSFEGKPRMRQALEAISTLKNEVDTLITVSNDRLLRIIPPDTPVNKAFEIADDVLRQAVVGVSEIIMRPGLINVDFADVKSIMSHAGTALMGIGKGSGKNRAREAALAAISSPLLDIPIQRAKGVMFNIVGGKDLQLNEVNEAADIIYDAVDSNANIIFGALIDDSATSGEISITVIATGFPDDRHGDPASVDYSYRNNKKKPFFLTSKDGGDSSSGRSMFGRLFPLAGSSRMSNANIPQNVNSRNPNSSPPPNRVEGVDDPVRDDGLADVLKTLKRGRGTD